MDEHYGWEMEAAMKGIRISMTKQIMIAVLAGAAAGLLFGEKIKEVRLLGDIFLRLIQMSVVVLIMGAVIEAVGSLKPQELGRLGAGILFWFSVSTVMAAAIGILLGRLIAPGAGISMGAAAGGNMGAESSISQIILELFPENIISAMARADMIQVILFAVLFGLALAMVREQQGDSPLMGLIKEFNQVILKMVQMVMKTAPLGIGALMAYTTGTAGASILLPLAKFLGAFALGTVLHLGVCIVYTAVSCKTGVGNLARKLCPMTLVAFTTTSSAVSLPVKMKDSEEKLGVSKRISGLVNPLGMTLNSNGLSMYLALACLTISQIYGMQPDMGMLIKVVALSSLACLGTVVVPGGGIMALTIIVPGLGLPMESIALLSGIDWFSGMFRTVLNVDIDALAAMLVAKKAGELDREVLNRKIVKQAT